jgi:hypothetical protein
MKVKKKRRREGSLRHGQIVKSKKFWVVAFSGELACRVCLA